MKFLRGGVTAPSGFLAAGLHAGIKKRPLLDLALVLSRSAGPVAAVFTRNRVVAAPLVLDRQHLRGGRGRAIIVNSGNANACTGVRGWRDANETARLVATQLGIPLAQVFVGSTGVIGQPLPMPPIRRGIPRLVAGLHKNGGRAAARAIMTTDTRLKESAAQERIGGRLVTVGGMAKGSGMIHPDMATMLAYLTTDAGITRRALQRALTAATDDTFNCISVDGDTSTNDTVLCLANGAADNRPIDVGTADFRKFQRLLHAVSDRLARAICWDGEGVTKVVELRVTGARNHGEARQLAATVATSLLVKTALFGEDANWGRIVAAAGRAGVRIDPNAMALTFDRVPIVRRGVSVGAAAERRIARVVKAREFGLTLAVGRGPGRARIWFTDLSYDYVRINASYRT